MYNAIAKEMRRLLVCAIVGIVLIVLPIVFEDFLNNHEYVFPIVGMAYMIFVKFYYLGE